MKFIPSALGIDPGNKETVFHFAINGINRPEIVFCKRLRMWNDEWLYITCSVYRHEDGDLMTDYDRRGWTPAEIRQIADFARCIKQ